MKSLCVCLVLVSLAVGAPRTPDRQVSRPNILFILADDHAYQAMSAYGSRINHTPHLDRLAREGMLFRNALVTNSICAPSRAVILTGKYSHLNGVLDNRTPFDGSQQTMPKLLQKAGYQTALVGKWHLQSDPTGFDYWEVLPGQGDYYNPDFLTSNGRTQHEGYVTDITTDLALDWLQKKRDANKPFLLMYQHKAPHRNWMPGPKHLTRYDGMTIPEPDNLFDDYSGRASPARNSQMEIDRHMTFGFDLKIMPDKGDRLYQAYMDSYGRLTPEQKRVWDAIYEPKNTAFQEASLIGRDLVRWKYQRYIKDYLRTVDSLDDNVGRVLRWLDATGLADNTIVVYTSDQGFYIGEHGWFDKRWMYEESLKTPLLVRWPGFVQAGSESHAMVSNIDIPETLLEIAGAAVPDDMQGRSLVPILETGDAPSDWRRTFYYHYYENEPTGAGGVVRHYGVRTERHKLIHYYEDNEWELFDLAADPMEMHSRYADPAYEDVQDELLAALKSLREELKVPEKDPYPEVSR
ncbi:MAG: sulfatase-like hydrolase/transferase [Luteitalea sp.]|nr:sulfatase-like hydrolase/transferase [Luteitalea sp.]